MSATGSRQRRIWLALAAAVLCEVSATLALKAALTHPAWYALVVAGYVGAFLWLSACLRWGLGIGVAYGFWGAGGVLLTACLSAVFFGEPMTPLMAAGMALIIGGVLLVEMGSPTPEYSDPVAAVTTQLPWVDAPSAHRSEGDPR